MKYKQILTLGLVTLALSLSAVAQSPAAQSDAQKSFDKLKTLAATWQGPVTLDPPMAEMAMDKPIQVSLRVTSKGNSLVHEMQEAGTPLDATKYDHPVTMFYLENDHLLLTHYCDAGNRPRMTARTSTDGKTVEFDFLDVSGGTQQRTHAPRHLHFHRRQPPHRGLDLYDAR